MPCFITGHISFTLCPLRVCSIHGSMALEEKLCAYHSGHWVAALAPMSQCRGHLFDIFFLPYKSLYLILLNTEISLSHLFTI